MESSGRLYLTSDESVLFDFNYRYKIVIPYFRFEKRNGKTITVFVNLDEFSNQLEFDKVKLMRVIGILMSCKSGFYTNENKGKTNKSFGYLLGEYSDEDLKKIIYGFIKTYILCHQCDKPELIFLYSIECKACGYIEIYNKQDKIQKLISSS